MSHALLTLFAVTKPRKNGNGNGNGKGVLGLAPGENELGLAVLAGARLAIQKRYIGTPPRGMDTDDLISLIIPGTLRRCERWRSGGPKKLHEYAYLSGCHELTELMRKRAKASLLEENLDVLDAPNVISLEQLKRAV